MPKRLDFPLGGNRRKLERQQADRERSERRRKLGRVAEAFERRASSRDRPDRSWRRALTSGRAPFPRSREVQRTDGDYTSGIEA
jgi:hypothetical protein